MGDKGRGLLPRVKRYITHDLREIILPSSLPNPPGFVPPPPLTLRGRWAATSRALRLYLDSWDTAKLDAAVRRQRGEPEPDPNAKEKDVAELKELAEEFGDAARGGARALVPYLSRLYETRAASYRDSAKQVIAGYKEGFEEAHRPEEPAEAAAEAAAEGAAAEQGASEAPGSPGHPPREPSPPPSKQPP